MTALQKEIYKGFLTQNHELLESITNRSNVAGAKRVGNLQNILMQLRKTLDHPFLINDIEEAHSDPVVVHKRLVEASGKLLLLQPLLRKLRDGGHRVLI